jgi:hypothetical protein
MMCPGSKFWYYSAIACSGMPIITIILKCQFVIHDYEKVCACFVHLTPILIFWNIHWNIRGTDEAKEWGFYDATNDSFTLDTFSTYLVSFLFNLVVYITIYYGILYIRWDVIKKNNYTCIFKVEYETPYMQDIIKRKGFAYGILTFTCFLITFTTIYAVTIIPCMFSQTWLLMYMGYLYYSAVKRGGTYYINHFPSKYPMQLQKFDELGIDFDFMKLKYGKSINPLVK